MESDKIRKAGIANIIGSALLLAFLVGYIVCLYTFVSNSTSDSLEEGLGKFFIVLIFLPASLIGLPFLIANFAYQLVLGFRLLGFAKHIDNIRYKPSKGMYIASKVLKIVFVVVFAILAYAIWAIMSTGGKVLGIVFALFTLFIIVYEIFLIVLENKVRNLQ